MSICTQTASRTPNVIGVDNVIDAAVRGDDFQTGSHGVTHSITTSTENRRVSGCGPTLGMT
jgi:hypothetical protein